MLDENRGFLPGPAVKRHVDQLNRHNSESLAGEWEVLLLNVLSKLGTVEYEKQFSGAKKPDIFFKSPTLPQFLADITTVSDASYESNNPTEYFHRCIREYFRENGIPASGLFVQIDSKKVGAYRNSKVRLCLPHKSEIYDFVRRHFKPVVDSIKTTPRRAFRTMISEGRANIQVSFNPNDRHFAASHSSYNVPYSLRRNPIYNRLKVKSRQLRESGFEGLAGVFLCDGNCIALRSAMPAPEEYTKQGIIREAFRQNSTLSFVVTLTVDERRHPLGIEAQRHVKAEFYVNPQSNYIASREFCERLSAICEFFPVPQATPDNALRHMATTKHLGCSFFGGGCMHGNEITIPSRTLTEILSGTLKYNATTNEKAGPLAAIAWMREFFQRQVSAGRTIDGVSMVKCPDEDDDWIKIRYGHPDPAISEFK